MADSPDGPKDAGMQPLFDLILRHVAPPTVEDGPVPHDRTILEANPISAASSPAASPPAPSSPTSRQGAGRRRKLIEDRAYHKNHAFRGIERTPLEEAEAGDIVAIAGLTKGHRGRYLLRPFRRHAAAGAADRSADGVDVVHRQQLAAGRHRRRQGHEPHDPRPPAARGRRAMSRCA